MSPALAWLLSPRVVNPPPNGASTPAKYEARKAAARSAGCCPRSARGRPEADCACPALHVNAEGELTARMGFAGVLLGAPQLGVEQPGNNVGPGPEI
jgi:hypothetical protein